MVSYLGAYCSVLCTFVYNGHIKIKQKFFCVFFFNLLESSFIRVEIISAPESQDLSLNCTLDKSLQFSHPIPLCEK